MNVGISMMHRSISGGHKWRLRAVAPNLFKFRLDFTPTASVCRSMGEFDRDKISERFASLTGMLEDAAGLAVSGQSSDLTKTAADRLIEELWGRLNTCVDILAGIKRELRR